jgi:nucleotide-binding universal stress UspA family protein
MLKISKILLPVDFSEHGSGAARYAAALARHFHSTLTLLHVNEIYSPALATPQDYRGPLNTGWITALETERLQALNSYHIAEFRDLDVQRFVVSGDAARHITERAHQEKTDLVVMSTHGYGPFRRMLVGSVTAKVLHDVECPVWTGAHMREAAKHEWKAVRNVLCAIDGGPSSDRVLTWARDFAGSFGAPLLLVHAIPAVGDESKATRAERARAQIDFLKTELGVKAETKIVEGEPAVGVASEAARTSADIVVIGRSPHSNELGRLRPNAYAIIRGSPCPVVSI